jgi:hypothetical protein
MLRGVLFLRTDVPEQADGMMARIVWLTSALVLSAGPGLAQPLEFASTAYRSTPGARAVVAVDVNRDGWLDLATANTGRNTVAILLNRGDGTGFAPAVETPVGAGPFDIDAGDLNRDGIPDLVVTTPDAHAIEVLLMGADGRPASRSVTAAGSESRGAALADVTRDGILDLVYSDYARHRVVVLPGTEAGGFAFVLADVAVSAKPQDVAAADVNHDGLVDIVVASTGANAIDVLYGAASGAYARRSVGSGRTLNALTLVDLNADGWEEIAAAATSTNVLVIFRGSASGFALAGTRAVGSSPRGIARGDLNQDGRADLVVANFGAGSATVLLGRRDGSVLPDRWGDLPSGSGARAVATGDFNNDGRLDLAVGPQSASRVWVHDNDTAFVAPALSFRQQSTGFFFYTPLAVADFNDNGIPDVLADRTIVLDSKTTVRLAIDARASVIDVDAADYDRDGHQDALVAKGIFDGQGRPAAFSLDLYLGNGRGQFRFGRMVEGMPNGLQGFRRADLDRDGHLDVVAFSHGELYVKRGIGSGPLVETVIPLPAEVAGFELGDMNRDGVLDAVVAHFNPASISVYPGDGSGGFGAPAVAASDIYFLSFGLGDLNHDGRLDIVADDGSVVVTVMASDDGGWAAPVHHPSTIPWDTASGTILGDFNHDGHLDFLSWGGTMLFGDGRGGFGPPAEFVFLAPQGFGFDWNRDGTLDIIDGGQFILNERRAVNRPPIADAGPDRSFRYHEQFRDLEWCEFATPSVDPDLHRLSLEWRDETGTIFNCVFPPKRPGTYTFTLTVRDGRGGESSDRMRVTIVAEPEIVLHLANALAVAGRWTSLSDETAASGRRFHHPNAGEPKVEIPSANPGNHVDIFFAPDPTQIYKLWVRLKADGNHWSNDSVWLQFEGAVGPNGRPAYAIGTTGGLAINLEECSGCGISGWGWEDDGWGATNRNGVLLRFPEGGVQRIRMQVREDGVSVDQIVLSAVKYRTVRPGAAKNDTVIVPATQ